MGADKLRGSKDVVDFVASFFNDKKPVGVICHAPWTLAEANVIRGLTLTSFPTLQTDIENAGGTWVDEEVVVCEHLVTNRNSNDLPAFSPKARRAVRRLKK